MHWTSEWLLQLAQQDKQVTMSLAAEREGKHTRVITENKTHQMQWKEKATDYFKLGGAACDRILLLGVGG